MNGYTPSLPEALYLIACFLFLFLGLIFIQSQWWGIFWLFGVVCFLLSQEADRDHRRRLRHGVTET